MSYLFKYFLHYSKCITMYLCMYTCTYLVECVTLYGPPSSLPSAVSAHSSAMHWPRLRCASSSPPSSSSSSRTIERGCRPDRTRGARTAMISGVWSARNTRFIASDSSNREDGERLSGEEPGGHRPRVSAGERLCPGVSAGLGARCGGLSPDALRSCSRLLLTSAMLFVWLQDPAGIFELVEVVGNGTYGQVYKVGVDWVLLHSQRALLHLWDYSVIVLQHNSHFYWSRAVYQRLSSADGCDLLRMRRDTQCDKKPHWL